MYSIIMELTLSSCFYIFKSKFSAHTYIQWMNNFLSIVNNFNLVIYTDKESSSLINTNDNPRIKIVIKPITEWYGYKYRKNWERNHARNHLLNNRIQWEVNMLWSEKVSFVYESYINNYFETSLYGWCDIGYFRNRPNDLNTLKLYTFGKSTENLNKLKINYACVNEKMISHYLKRTEYFNGLPYPEIPHDQVTVAGGFFVLPKEHVEWWKNKYYTKLELYFENNKLIKDDQIIILSCILESKKFFQIHLERNREYDNWFMFQRLLQGNV